MKKISFLIVIYCCLLNSVASQKTIEFDFKTMQPPKIENIKQGDYYQIKIKNINLNLFKVSLTTIDTILSKPQQTPMFGGIDQDAIAKVIAGISSSSTSITELLETFTSTIDLLKITSFTPEEINANSSIIETMKKEKESLIKVKEAVAEIAERIDLLKFEIGKIRLNSYTVINPASSYDFNEALNDIEKIRKDISDLKSEMKNKQSTYETFSTANRIKIAANSDLSSNDKSIKESYSKIISVLSETLSSISADKAIELLSSIVFIENNKENTFTSMPIQFLGEQAKVQISIVPRDEKYTQQSYITSVTFPDIVNDYTVVGLSFYTASLYDEAYSTIKTKVSDSTYNFNLKEEDAYKAEVGVTALLRYGTKFKQQNNIGLHLSIGAGVSISNKIKPRMLFGGGFSIGQKHMLAIDFGGIVGYTEKLSSAIELTKTYTENPSSITVSKLRLGAFASIGYVYQF